MECVGLGGQNFAAMVVSFSPSSSRLRLRRMKLARRRASFCGHGIRWHNRSQSRCLKVKAKAGAGGESCVAVKQNVPDEEDYIKAGGSELVFVQMQQNKSMEMQSKLADKVSAFQLCFVAFYCYFRYMLT